MESIVAFFENLGNAQKFLWIIICLSVFWLAEGIFPLVKFNYQKWKHARVNLVLLTTTIIINVLFGLATAGVFIWTSTNGIGLLHMVEMPLWLEVLVGVMILDLVAQYVVHYLLHRVKFMWRFHMVHHSDSKVDATTGTRHHPGDYVLREVFALAAIVLAGVPLAAFSIAAVAL